MNQVRKFLNDHYAFFSCLLVLAMAGGAFTFLSGKADATLFFSENRSEWGNAFFKAATILGEEPSYFIAGLAMLAVRVRFGLLIGLTGLSVMGVSAGLKALFAAERPFTFFDRTGALNSVQFVDGVNLLVGQNSFPSGHSMAAFALCGMLVFLLPKRKRFGFGLFFLALSVALSRVYLVQHFWRDVFAGALTGVVVAALIYGLQCCFPLGERRLDKPVFRWF